MPRPLRLRLSLCTLSLAAACASPVPPANDPAGVDIEAKIIGGQAEASFPAAGILLEQGQFFCSSTLIAPQWVLSAAHCFGGQGGAGNGRVWGVGAGQDQLEATYEIEQVIIHPGFRDTLGGDANGVVAGDLFYDIAMVKLAQPVQGVEPIPLLRALDTSRAQQATLVSFGADFTHGPGTDRGGGVKRRTEVTFEVFQQHNMKYENRGTSACRGDSGGPALFAQPDGGWAVGGVTSWGDLSCAEFGWYARVDTSLDFIEGTMNGQGGAQPGAQPEPQPQPGEWPEEEPGEQPGAQPGEWPEEPGDQPEMPPEAQPEAPAGDDCEHGEPPPEAAGCEDWDGDGWCDAPDNGGGCEDWDGDGWCDAPDGGDCEDWDGDGWCD